jgi:hypothetical protein
MWTNKGLKPFCLVYEGMLGARPYVKKKKTEKKKNKKKRKSAAP